MRALLILSLLSLTGGAGWIWWRASRGRGDDDIDYAPSTPGGLLASIPGELGEVALIDAPNAPQPVINEAPPIMIARTTSDAGVDAIKRREGFRGSVYQAGAGKDTIGYGHVITIADRISLRFAVQPISEAKASDVLRDDLSAAESPVLTRVAVPLTQGQFDALVSFAFNVGASAFASSTLLRKLNAGDYDGAADEFGRWKYITVNGAKVVSDGLVNRRAQERKQFEGNA